MLLLFIEILLEEVPLSISQNQKDFLLRPYTPDEVRLAMFSIDGNKSRGHDGF